MEVPQNPQEHLYHPLKFPPPRATEPNTATRRTPYGNSTGRIFSRNSSNRSLRQGIAHFILHIFPFLLFHEKLLIFPPSQPSPIRGKEFFPIEGWQLDNSLLQDDEQISLRFTPEEKLGQIIISCLTPRISISNSISTIGGRL